jgi:pimeloyl-ACP methyl ester carboxylesterase
VTPHERIMLFGSEGLVGIVTEPADPGLAQSRPAVVFINAGMVHRIGPNRMYVRLARHLAGRGFRSVRFDLSGIGDSRHRRDGLPADESAVLETRQVMDAVEQTTGCRSFVLAGLCSGAVTAFHTAVGDPRVVGGVLLNPQGFHHDAEWNAHILNRTQARRYVKTALRRGGNWRRALTGRIDYTRAWRVLFSRATGSVRDSGVVASIAGHLKTQFRALEDRQTRLLTVCCEGDSSIDYLSAILGFDAGQDRTDPSLRIRVFKDTDHSVTLDRSQRALVELVEGWAGEFWERAQA